MKNLNVLDWIAMILVIIGGLNWGLVGLFNFNLVSFLFADAMIIARIIYVLVGISAIYVAVVVARWRKKG